MDDSMFAMNARHKSNAVSSTPAPLDCEENGDRVGRVSVTWNFTMSLASSTTNTNIAAMVLSVLLSQSRRPHASQDPNYVDKLKQKIQTYFKSMKRKSRQSASDQQSRNHDQKILGRRNRVSQAQAKHSHTHFKLKMIHGLLRRWTHLN